MPQPKNGIEIRFAMCYNTKNNGFLSILVQYTIILHPQQYVKEFFVEIVVSELQKTRQGFPLEGVFFFAYLFLQKICHAV